MILVSASLIFNLRWMMSWAKNRSWSKYSAICYQITENWNRSQFHEIVWRRIEARSMISSWSLCSWLLVVPANFLFQMKLLAINNFRSAINFSVRFFCSDILWWRNSRWDLQINCRPMDQEVQPGPIKSWSSCQIFDFRGLCWKAEARPSSGPLTF